MENPNRFYTYAYLRKNRTPYYIGKGKGDRAYKKGSRIFAPPKDKSRIIFLKQNITEEEAFKHEIYMIAVFGRKDLGTGILHNRTNGGEGASNPSQETRMKIGKARIGKPLSKETKRKIGKKSKGRKHNEETIKRICENTKGTKNPFYGKRHSEETKRKISQNCKGHSGIPHSQEAKEKIRDAKRKNYKFISPTGNLIEERTSLKEFARKYELHLSGLSRLVNKKITNHKGWTLDELA